MFIQSSFLRRFRRAAAVVAASTLLTLAAAGQKPPASTPEVQAALAPFVSNHTLAGAVTLVASPDKVLSVDTVGYSDVAARKAMSGDAIFWIASMSKPITAAAFMMLVDEGKVSLDDPVEKYLPEFKGQWVAVEKDKEHMLLKPAPPITVRQVLSHTSGLPFETLVEKPVADVCPLNIRVPSYAMSPLEFAPGSDYKYSNAGINTAGRIIEVVTGVPYEKFLQDRLLTPLGMRDTTFRPSGEQLARLAKSYKSNQTTGGLEELEIGRLHYPLDDPKRQASPAGGLFSTARDVARFCQMMLSGGTFEGRRYLSAAAIEQMASVQTGNIVISEGTLGYGLGWSVVRKGGEEGGMRAGSYGHGGAYKTSMWIDPQRRLIFVLMRQHTGDFTNPEGKKIQSQFVRAAIARFGDSK